MKLPVIDLSGKKSGNVTVADDVFAAPMNAPLLAQAVHVYEMNQRQASAKALTRGEVYGSRRKLWRQKGTGRARHGDRFAPQFVGGGVAHGPTGKQNLKRTMNETMRRKALQVALSAKQQGGNLVIVDRFDDHEKTRDVMVSLTPFKKTTPLLCVSVHFSETMRRATRNLADVLFVTPASLNAFMVLSARKLLIEKNAIPLIEQHFLGKGQHT